MQTAMSKIQPVFKKISAKTRWREILAMLMLLLAIVFFRSERKELHAIIPQLKQASPFWLVIGSSITIVYTLFQAGIYRQSFAAIGLPLRWPHATALFLKRNFISIFLPAGGVSSLAYSPSQIRKQGFNQSEVHQASGIFAFTGMLTVLIVGTPIIIYTVLVTSQFKNTTYGLISILLLIILLASAFRSIRKKGRLYQWIDKRFPSFTPSIDELFAINVNPRHFSGAILFSIGVELCGIITIYVGMLALGMPASPGASAAAYIIAVIMMIVSPFLRGLGVVELSMVYVLEQFGYNSTHALSITIFYRVFEFWLPLLAGFVSFVWKGRHIFLRAFPALLTFTLGIVNIISAITPSLHNRSQLLHEYLPVAAIHASHMLVLFLGLSLLVTSAFLFRGLRNAWIIALGLAVFSCAGNLAKALDYEEALFALFTVVVLAITASQYRIRSSNKWMRTGFKTTIIGFAAVLVFGFISFYFIDIRHFGVDFTWKQSLLHTFKIFLLIEDNSLHPITRFGHEFVWLIRWIGFITWGFFLFTLIKQNKEKNIVNENYRDKAKFLLTQYGNSSMDYFKTYKDKLFFLSDIHDAFIAYRIAGGFAIVLEEPVCAAENKIDVLEEFDRHCRKMGLKPAFYRVDENSIPWFNQLRKNKLLIGQEAILEVNRFSLEGKDKKSLRNGIGGLQKKGYIINFCPAPQTPELIRQLKKVSDEWLQEFERNESIFSQGMFDEIELKDQDIITVEDGQRSIYAFLNIIPDYAEYDCTYDLIRKTKEAPAAAMDALIVRLIEYAKEHNKQYLNLGLVPMTGILHPDNTAEQIIKIAAEKIKRFHHYKGLRAFKDKYATFWDNKYLIYDDDFDLLQLPIALSTVMKP
ncbi:MAG TPA: phosphatidylglycerol lysyltransferase domain-containing protein [Chitinophagaceae bacterium]